MCGRERTTKKKEHHTRVACVWILGVAYKKKGHTLSSRKSVVLPLCVVVVVVVSLALYVPSTRSRSTKERRFFEHLLKHFREERVRERELEREAFRVVFYNT